MKHKFFVLNFIFLLISQASFSADQDPNSRALTVESAFLRSIEMHYGYMFSKTERDLVRHFVDNAVEATAFFSVDGFCARALSNMDNYFQRVLCEWAICDNYDDLILARKYIIKQQIKNAIKDGVEQIIFLGGGYDIRSLITASENPDIAVYELDTGATRDNKIQSIRTIPFYTLNIDNLTKSKNFTTVYDNLFYIDFNLNSASIEETLRPFGFSENKKTLIVAEDLTANLDNNTNTMLLKMIASIFKHEESKVLIGYNDSAYLPLTWVPYFVKTNGFDIKEKLVPTELLNSIYKNKPYIRKYEHDQQYYFLLEKEQQN